MKVKLTKIIATLVIVISPLAIIAGPFLQTSGVTFTGPERTRFYPFKIYRGHSYAEETYLFDQGTTMTAVVTLFQVKSLSSMGPPQDDGLFIHPISPGWNFNWTIGDATPVEYDQVIMARIDDYPTTVAIPREYLPRLLP